LIKFLLRGRLPDVRLPPGTMKNSHKLLTIFAVASALVSAALAQIPDTVKHHILGQAGGLQRSAYLGSSVAVDAGFAVAGVPHDSFGDGSAGVVKVFDVQSGALLHFIPNPAPGASDFFGYAVAISGSRLVVGAPNADAVYVYDLSGPTPTVPVFTLPRPGMSSNDGFGDAVSVSGSLLVVGAPGDDTGVPNAGSVYVYDLSSATPTVPMTTLHNPDPVENDCFGKSLSVSGTRIVVGAPYDDAGANDAGTVYAYELASATPAVPVATLNNPSPAAGDNFGDAVAISGARGVVGAPRDDTGASDAGSVYVYELVSGTPTVPVVTLNNPAPGVEDTFGCSVAISGARVVVGADHDGPNRVGSARVYDVSGGTPTVPVYNLNNPTPTAYGAFGTSVAISGTSVLVGEPYDDAGVESAGSAHVYNLAGTTPSVSVATLNNPGPAPASAFGSSVAIAGTLMVVGAPADNTGTIRSGSAYVYDLASATPLVPVVVLRNPTPAGDDLFGSDVAISGHRVVVGAPGDDQFFGSGFPPSGYSDCGRAYVYDLTSATPTVPAVTLTELGPRSQFGVAVAISGSRVVVGANRYQTNQSNIGRAFVYDLAGATPAVAVATLDNPSPATDDWFGGAVAVSGTRVAIAAEGDDTAGHNAGSVYVYDFSGATPPPVVILHHPEPSTYPLFGRSIAISGTHVAVGSPWNQFGEQAGGSVYVYDVGSATPTAPKVTIHNPHPQQFAEFGSALAMSGTLMVVGAYHDNTGGENAGRGYVFDFASAMPAVPVATLNDPSPKAGDEFGRAVGIDGFTVIVGVRYDDAPLYNNGSAYVFGPASNDTDADGLLDIWEYARFGTLAGNSAAADTDHDGLPELMELAFDKDPLVPNPKSGLEPVLENGFLTMTIQKRAGVNYLGESAASVFNADFSAATTTVLIDDATTLKVRDNVPVSTVPGGRFLRMKVIPAP
jgi:hypothetical protein